MPSTRHILIVNGRKVRQPVFIIGAPHSGTHLLARALKRSDGVHLTIGQSSVLRVIYAFARRPSIHDGRGEAAASVLRDAFGQGWRITPHGCMDCVPECREAAGLAAERGVSVDWVHADLLDYQPGPGRYNLVLIAYIQLPADRLTALARTAASALAPGGTLLAIGHDRDNLDRGHAGPKDPSVLWTPQVVTAGLTGLTVQQAEQVNRTVTTPDGERTAIDTLVRAVRPRQG